MSAAPALDRRIGVLGAWALALGCIVGWGAFMMPGTTFLPLAGPLGTAIALTIAGVIMAVIALNFHFMMNRYPQAGGAFIYALRTFGRQHGFVCAWFLALAYLVPIPLNATALAMISRDLMDGILEFGLSYNIAGYHVYLGETLIIAVVLLLFTLVILRSGHAASLMQTVLAVLLVASVGFIAIATLGSPETSLEALQPPFSPSEAPVLGILAIIATSPWAFVGFDVLSQVSEEASFDLRKAGAIMVVAIAMGAAIYIALNTIAASVTPVGYADWAAYIEAAPQLSGLQTLPLFYAVHEVLGPTGLVALDIATLAAILTGIIGFYMASSRIFYAMANNGVLPRWFGKLDEKHHTPRNAILVILAVALLSTLFGRTILGWLIDMLSVSTAIGFFYTSAAVWRVAGREGKRNWKLLGIIGVVFSVAFLLLLLVPNPLLGNALNQESYVFLIAWAILGINFYSPSYKSNVTQLPGATEIES